jgi:hypothetical protein
MKEITPLLMIVEKIQSIYSNNLSLLDMQN